MNDLSSRLDIERLVDDFYDRVRSDECLGPIFNDIACVDWSEHLPKMYAFWETVLFGASDFKGNPLAVHRDLARRTPLGNREFDRWIELFHETVDALFTGRVAAHVKRRAVHIAAVMQHHIDADRAVGCGL